MAEQQRPDVPITNHLAQNSQEDSIMCNMEDDECNDLVVELKNDVGDIETFSLAVEWALGKLYDGTNFVHKICTFHS